MVTADSNFKFEKDINNFCRKSSQKLHALSRISQCLSPHKKRIFLKTFVTSQFNYCPLAWMCHSRTINNRINNIHNTINITYITTINTLYVLLVKILHLRKKHLISTSVCLSSLFQEKMWLIKRGLGGQGGGL